MSSRSGSSPVSFFSSSSIDLSSMLINAVARLQGGYFIINGSEKVLIAQERMAANHIYVFAKAQPSPVNFLAEIRSMVEKGGKTISMMQVKMYHRGQEKTVRSTSLLSSFSVVHLSSTRRGSRRADKPSPFFFFDLNRAETRSRRPSPTFEATFPSSSSSEPLESFPIRRSSSTSATTRTTPPCWICSSPVSKRLS